MRGYPLVSTVIVLFFFALAWIPLSQLTGESANDSELLYEVQKAELQEPVEVVESSGVTLRVFATHELKQLKVEYLGKPVMSLEETNQSTELEQKVDGVEITPEGIEFWVEARFTEVAEGQRSALGIEAVPNDPALEPIQVTLWGRAGETYVGDLAVFEWPKTEEDAR